MTFRLKVAALLAVSALGLVALSAVALAKDGSRFDTTLSGYEELPTLSTSGNGTFDRAALRAVMEASPLPPLPFAYNGTFLGVHLTFK